MSRTRTSLLALALLPAAIQAALASPIDLGALGSQGFQIKGAARGDGSGASVSGAGDVNGDGLDDLIVGSQYTGPYDASYVVFGKAGTASVDLATLGSRGFRIHGAAVFDEQSRIAVSGAGDVNGDGLDDLIVGAYVADHLGGDDAGSSYVVFGRGGHGTSRSRRPRQPRLSHRWGRRRR